MDEPLCGSGRGSFDSGTIGRRQLHRYGQGHSRFVAISLEKMTDVRSCPRGKILTSAWDILPGHAPPQCHRLLLRVFRPIRDCTDCTNKGCTKRTWNIRSLQRFPSAQSLPNRAHDRLRILRIYQTINREPTMLSRISLEPRPAYLNWSR